MTLDEADAVARDERSLLSPDKPETGAYPAPCPVVGLGASAGGLEAFQNFLMAVPPDSGHAYVLVQHLDPNHESMLVIGATTADEYLERLRQNSMEADLLFRDLLINVTCFFRDAEAFNILRRDVIPELLKDKGAGDTVRIWAPGCSSGEEAYSLA